MRASRIAFAAAFAAVICTALWTAAEQQQVTLQYDDGAMDGKKSVAGSGHAILFSKPEGTWYLSEVQLFGSRYGHPRPPAEDFSIYVCDKDFNVIKEYARPYGTFGRGPERWRKIALEPVQVPSQFYVCFSFNPTGTKGIYVGYDSSVAETHSKYGVPGSHLKPISEGFEWMIRAVLNPTPAVPSPPSAAEVSEAVAAPDVIKEGDNIVLKYDDDSMDGKKSVAGSGHAVLFSKPDGTWYLNEVRLFGSRYGYPQPPAEDFYVYVCDKGFKVIKEYARPYGTFERGPERWYKVALEPVELPSEFYVCFSFNPTATKGVYVAYDSSVAQTHSKYGVPGSHLEPVPEGFEWMIRTVLSPTSRAAVTEAPAPSPPSPPPVLQPALLPGGPNVFESKRAIVDFSGTTGEYGEAMARIVEISCGAFESLYGIKMPERIVVLVIKADSLRLWNDGNDRITLELPSQEKLGPPAKSGAHHVYGLCHEVSHIAMYRNIKDVASLPPGWGEGWAHYAASMGILPEVWARLGSAAWPEPHNYFGSSGPARLLKQFVGMDPASPDAHLQAAKIFYDAEQKYGKSGVGQAMNAVFAKGVRGRDFPKEFEAALASLAPK